MNIVSTCSVFVIQVSSVKQPRVGRQEYCIEYFDWKGQALANFRRVKVTAHPEGGLRGFNPN